VNNKSEQKFIIVKSRVELYKDFAMNLLYYIDRYYIDFESLNTKEDIFNHFSFCYNKVCDEFLKEEINFKENAELKEYFHTYYYHQYYMMQNNAHPLDYYEKFWKTIFDIDKHKNRNIVNILIEIYQIYDKSINHEKNILEIV
jgi:hypothetical protein